MTHLLRRRLHPVAAQLGGLLGLVMVLLLTVPGRADAACPSCGTSPCTISGTSTIGSGETCDYTGKDVILTGTLQGDNNALCYTVKARDLTVRGTLRARGSCIVVDLTGTFKTEIVSNSAARVDVRDADDFADGVTITAAAVVLNGRDINADGATGLDAGFISITATNGSVTGSGSGLSLHATGSSGGSGGSIEVASNTASIDLPGSFDASGGGGVGALAFGGSILLDAATAVTAGAASHSLEAQGAGDGDGGSIDIFANNGTATINGNMNVNGNGDFAFGGEITVEGNDVTTGTTWNARGDQAGFGGTIDITAFEAGCQGTITTTSGTGSFNTLGGSGGGDGGDITLSATGSITLAGDMDSAGVGEFSLPGTISIDGGSCSTNTLTVQSTSRIEADGSGADASNGFITVSACNIVVDGVLDTRNTQLVGGGGTNDLTYAGTLTTGASSSLLADNAADGGANEIFCRCIDTSPADGTCDGTPTCVSPPTLNGTVTPTATIIPIAMAACN